MQWGGLLEGYAHGIHIKEPKLQWERPDHPVHGDLKSTRNQSHSGKGILLVPYKMHQPSAWSFWKWKACSEFTWPTSLGPAWSNKGQMGFCKGTSGTPSLSFVLLDKSMLVHQQDIREWYHTCVSGAVINERYSQCNGSGLDTAWEQGQSMTWECGHPLSYLHCGSYGCHHLH